MLENGKDFFIYRMGKTRKKHIKDARSGQGNIMQDVRQAMEEADEQLGENHGKVIVPVVVTYQRNEVWEAWSL
ncbi:MAG: hypothetical protein AAFV95_06775 [Bacteroidota bacterium]